MARELKKPKHEATGSPRPSFKLKEVWARATRPAVVLRG